MNGEWVEQGGGAAFSIPMTDMRQKPSGKKAPHHFLKKGTRSLANAPEPTPKTDVPKPKVQATPSSIKSRIQNYRKDAVPRDKFEDAVVVVPKRPSANFDAAQYQKQTEEAAQAYRRAKDMDDDANHPEDPMPNVPDHEEQEWRNAGHEELDPNEDERHVTRGNMGWKHGGAFPRRHEEEMEDEFDDDRMDFEDRGMRKPPPGRINQSYSRRPADNRRHMNDDSYFDEMEDVEDEDDAYDDPPARRGPTRGRKGGNVDGFKQFLVDKMKELEEEISTYKKENIRLQNITREQEIVLQKLMEEKEDARHQLEEDQAEFERYKEEEMKRLRTKAKQMEQRAKEAAKVIPKKEREEIEMLNNQLEQLREEMRTKESKARAERERLRKEISDLQLQNAQLQAAAREQQLKEINKQFDTRAAERRKPPNRPSYQRQYEQLQNHTYDDGAGDEEEEEEDEEYEEEDHGGNITTGTHGQVVQQAANQGRAPPASTSHIQTGGKSGHTSVSAGVTDKRRPVPSKPSSQPISRKEEVDSEEDPIEDLPDDEMIDSHTYPDNKVQRIFSSGKREIIYTNGTVKKMLPTGHVILHFSNGDIKKTFPSTKVIYYYAMAQTTHITYPNGMQVFEFVNQQVEKHYPDGMKEIAFPDGTIKYIYADGSEESVIPTGALSQAMARKMIKSSTSITVAKAHNLQPQDTTDDRSSTLF